MYHIEFKPFPRNPLGAYRFGRRAHFLVNHERRWLQRERPEVVRDYSDSALLAGYNALRLGWQGGDVRAYEINYMNGLLLGMAAIIRNRTMTINGHDYPNPVTGLDYWIAGSRNDSVHAEVARVAVETAVKLDRDQPVVKLVDPAEAARSSRELLKDMRLAFGNVAVAMADDTYGLVPPGGRADIYMARNLKVSD